MVVGNGIGSAEMEGAGTFGLGDAEDGVYGRTQCDGAEKEVAKCGDGLTPLQRTHPAREQWEARVDDLCEPDDTRVRDDAQ